MAGPGARKKVAGQQTAVDATAPATDAEALSITAAQIVAQYAAGAALDDSTGPFVIASAPRTARVVLGAGGADPVIYTITGTTPEGVATTETITAAGAGTNEGTTLWSTITRFQSNVDPLGTTDLRCSAQGYSPAPRAMFVGTSGSLVTRLIESNADVTFAAIPNGTTMPIRPRYVRLSSTATNVVALF